MVDARRGGAFPGQVHGSQEAAGPFEGGGQGAVELCTGRSERVRTVSGASVVSTQGTTRDLLDKHAGMLECWNGRRKTLYRAEGQHVGDRAPAPTPADHKSITPGAV